MWRKGQTHLGMFWKLWFDEYVLKMREGTEKHLKAPRTLSSTQPTEGDFLLVKENLPLGIWNLAVSNTGGEIRATTVHKAAGKLLKRTLNFLFPLECAAQRETLVKPSRSKDDQYDASHQIGGQKFTDERPVHEAAIKARQALNKLLNI